MRGTQRELPGWLILAMLLAFTARAGWELEWLRFGTAEADSGITWHAPGEATTLAESTGKPLLVAFTADWCLPCRKLEAETLADSRVVDLLERHFVATRLMNSKDAAGSTPGEEEWRKMHGVTAFPALVVILPGEERTYRSLGFVDVAEMRRFLEQAVLVHAAATKAGRAGAVGGGPERAGP